MRRERGRRGRGGREAGAGVGRVGRVAAAPQGRGDRPAPAPGPARRARSPRAGRLWPQRLPSPLGSSMYYDEDGDLAHEFYEETIVTKNGRKRAKLKRIHKNLIPQVMCGEWWGKVNAKRHGDISSPDFIGTISLRASSYGERWRLSLPSSFCLGAAIAVCPGSHPCHLRL